MGNLGKNVSAKLLGASDWVFSWRTLREPRFPLLVAALLVGVGFVVFFGSVRIRITPPLAWAARKASVIHVVDDATSHRLEMQAREGGPFPSRYEPSAWKAGEELEKQAMDEIRWKPETYHPVFGSLPNEQIPSILLGNPGEPIFPKRKLARQTTSPAKPPAIQLFPRLYALTGIRPEEIPEELPAFEADMTQAATAEETWRFLLRLDASGQVLDCVCLAGGDDEANQRLETWLRGVSFNPGTEKASRWVSLSLAFVNQAMKNP